MDHLKAAGIKSGPDDVRLWLYSREEESDMYHLCGKVSASYSTLKKEAAGKKEEGMP